MSGAPREAVLGLIRSRSSDAVPFCVWRARLPDGEISFDLLERGAAIINKAPVYRTVYDGVRFETLKGTTPEGHAYEDTLAHTPRGTLTTRYLDNGVSVWITRTWFDEPDKLDAFEYLLRSMHFEATPEDFARGDGDFHYRGRNFAGRAVGRPMTVHCPFHDLMYVYAGVEHFVFEWEDRRARMTALMGILGEQWRRKIDLIAASSCAYVAVESNIEVATAGLPHVREHYLPYIEEGCRLLHAAGKLVGAHLDGNNRLIAPLVADTELDFIESFTPAPDCDLTLEQALAAWPDKALIVNYPCSLFHDPPERFAAAARETVARALASGRCAVGIIEDIPPHRAGYMPLLQEIVTAARKGETL